MEKPKKQKASRKPPLKPDTVLKNYWNNNEQFADLFNAVLFGGEQVIEPEELEEMDTEESNVLEHKNYVESIRMSRDILKIEKKSSVHGIQLMLLGLENQEHIHYAMPMRVMGYDYSAYKKQYDMNAKKYTNAKELTEDEYLSKMKKTDKFTPVITLVIYYGEKPWDGAKTLHEMLHIPEKMENYINDYKLLLVEAGKSKLIFHNENNKDLFQMLQILLDKSVSWRETEKKAIDYVEEHKVEKSVVMAAAGIANRRLNYNNLLEGDGGMYTVFEEARMEGVQEGKREGKREGLREGKMKGKCDGRAQEIVEIGQEYNLSQEEILDRLQKKLNISLKQATKYLDTFSSI